MRFLSTLISTALFLAVVGVGSLATAKRVRDGHWSMPTESDVVWLVSLFDRDPDPARVIYLSRGPRTVTGGYDDSHADRTSLVPGGERRTVRGYGGSERAWRTIVGCVKRQFSAYDVVVTDQRPDDRGYVLVHVGGAPRDLGVAGHHVGGVAPFSGVPVPNPIVFAFSATLREAPLATCETIAHEVGHVYGLDHTYRCTDMMSYLRGCGAKRFVSVDVPCGEHQPRACKSGAPTQSSHRQLLEVLGRSPRRARVSSL